MLRFTQRRRAILAEKFGDLANLSFAALILGQAVSQARFSLSVGVAGLGMWVVFMGAAYLLSVEDR
jgi:hypothetical protein